MSYVHKIGSVFSGGARGPSVAATDDELFIANLPGPIGVGNGGQRWMSGAHSLLWKDAGDSLPRWRDRSNSGVAVGLSGSSMPSKGTAINSRQTIGVTGAHYLQSTVTLDAARNTVYGLIKPASSATVRALYGPVSMPVTSAPTDDVLNLAVGADGIMRWMRDTPAASALINSAAGDRRGVVTLFRCTMSPEYGKGILIHGFAEARNAALTASLLHTDLQWFRYGNQPSSNRYSGDVAELIVLPGVDYSDPAYADVHARLWTILAGWGGL